MRSRRRSSQHGQATVEWIGVLVVVALILGAAATSRIGPQVIGGVRCQLSRIFGSSSSGCAPSSSGAAGGTADSGGTFSGGGTSSGEGGTWPDRTGSPVVHADSLPPPAGYALYIARLNTYCQSHPRQRFHPEAPGMPWIPCGPYDRARRAMQGTGSVKKCVQNVLAGAGLGATRGLYVALKDGDVAASIADILGIVSRSSLEGAASGGVAGAALACLYGLAGG